MREEGRSVSSTGCFVVWKTVCHWEVAENRRLYLNTLDARRFGVVFSDRRSSTMFYRLRSVATRTSGHAIEGGRVQGSGVPVLWIRPVALICWSRVTRIELRAIALCVGSCLGQKPAGICGKNELVGWELSYKRSYFVKDADK